MPELIIISKKSGKEFRCLYDEEDHALISQFSWSVNPAGYVQTSIKGGTILMHRLILGVHKKAGILIDHRNHDPRDNRRANLRFCTPSENRMNSRKRSSSTSQFKGVYYETERGRFHSQIGLGDRVKNLGRYSDERQAGKIYDRHALEVFKDFAHLNFPSSREASQLTFSWWQ